MKQINNLIVVEVPEDAYDFEISMFDTVRAKNIKDKLIRICDLDPDNTFEKNCRILGKLSELSEEECKRFVSRFQSVMWKLPDVYFDFLNFKYENLMEEIRNYSVNILFPFETAKESLISLLQSNGIDTSKNLLIIEVL